MENFWDKKYSADHYIYGKEPNEFVVEKLSRLKPGKVLFAAEGEGRNAVFAASKGWETTAFDNSLIAKEKAEKLASEKSVTVHYKLADYDTFTAPEEYFNVIVFIFAHSASNNNYHQKMLKYLKKGGLVILEGFTKKQLSYNSGGPKNIDMLFSEEELRKDFESLSDIEIHIGERYLDEGPNHQGFAHTIQLFGKK